MLTFTYREGYSDTAHLPRGLTPNLPLQAVNGPSTILVILVKFPDKANISIPVELKDNFATINNYYNEDSYGSLSFQPTTTPSLSNQWYTLPQAMEYYGADTVSSDNQLVSDSLEAAYNGGVNLANYKFAVVIHSGNDEAITHSSSDIHSFTIPGFTLQPTPLTNYKISTSVVAESDPLGVYCHEFGHLLGLPDLYDLTQQIDPTNNFIGYWDIMALGEWNPNTGNPLDPQPGSFPAQHSAWSKIRLGFIPSSKITVVNPGELKTVTLENIELPTNGNQTIKIPTAVNGDGTLTYYLLEMRAQLGTFDRYLPFATGYPGAGILLYKVNESIVAGHGNVQLINAHPGQTLASAPFGPCSSPCVSNNAFSDPTYFVNVVITQTTPTAYTITIDRTSSPLLLLQVDTPAQGTLVSIDGNNQTSDSSKEVRITVHAGPHLLYIQPIIPFTIGGNTFQLGLSNTFAAWNDGNTADPRWISINANSVESATYRIMIETSSASALIALIILVLLMIVVMVKRRRLNISRVENISEGKAVPGESLPRDNRLPQQTIEDAQRSDET